MSASAEAVPEVEGPPLDRISFRRFSDQLLEIATKNACLGALTLGIYRFWGKTNIRRHFWNRVYLYGDPLEYTGTGKELLFGFLAAVVIVAPFYSLYHYGPSIANQSSLDLRIALSVFYSVCLAFGILLYHFAVFRTLRYRLSRTQWRGIAAGMDGSSWQYAKTGLAYSFLTVLSLGIAYPLQNITLFRKRVEAAHLGSVPFKFDGEVKYLLWRWIPLWIPLAGFTAGALFVSMQYFKSIEPFVTSQTKPPGPSSLQAWSMGTLPFVYVAAIVGYYWYRVQQIRYCLNHLHIAGISFRSTFKFRRLLISVILYGLATFAVIFPLLLIASTILHFAFGKNSVAGIIGMGFVGLIAYGASSFFYAVLIMQPVTRSFFDSFKSIGVPDFATIRHRQDPQKPRHGEGLADMFDIGAI